MNKSPKGIIILIIIIIAAAALFFFMRKPDVKPEANTLTPEPVAVVVPDENSPQMVESIDIGNIDTELQALDADVSAL